MSLIDDITIPLMLDCPIIFSNDIISKIKESESLDFFGVEPIYYIANYLTRSTFNKITKGIYTEFTYSCQSLYWIKSGK